MRTRWLFLLPFLGPAACVTTAPMRMLLKTGGNPEAQACASECKDTIAELKSLLNKRRELLKKPPLRRTSRFRTLLERRCLSECPGATTEAGTCPAQLPSETLCFAWVKRELTMAARIALGIVEVGAAVAGARLESGRFASPRVVEAATDAVVRIAASALTPRPVPRGPFLSHLRRAVDRLAAKVASLQPLQPPVRASYILYAYRGAQRAGPAVQRSREEAHSAARAAVARLKEGADFGDVAAAQSDCPTRSRRGSLGRVVAGTMEPVIESALFGLQPGTFSDVVDTPFGFAILRRDDAPPPRGPAPEEEADLGAALGGPGLEPGTDRPGADYRHFVVDPPDPKACQDACARESRCQAFSLLLPGVRGPKATCFLKSEARPAIPSRCCVSGVRSSALPGR